MKDRVLLFITLLILITPLSLALQINLIEPHTGAWLYSSTVVFKCQINPEGEVDTVRLYTNIGGSWLQTGTIFNNPNPSNIFNASFTVQGISNGNYLWNCKANGQYSSANSTFTVSIPANNPPTFSGTISNQTWNQDTSKTNVFDLDSFFSDPESNPVTYSSSGNSNINVNIASDGQVSLSQPSGWWGNEKVTFKACDAYGCTNSNQVTLTVSQVSQSNTPPTISGVSDQEGVVDDEWTIGLNAKISDAQDSDDLLNISVSGVDTSIFTVSVNDAVNELSFVAISEGTDTFTIRVTDTKGSYAEQTVSVTIEEESSSSSSTTSDEFDEEPVVNEFTEEEFSIEITTAVPDENKKVSLKPGQSQKFEITINEDGDIVWYVDNTKTQESVKSFTYTPKAAGMHIIKVMVGSGVDKDMRSWDVEVIQEENKTVNLCGNKKVDVNETCLTCPADVVCNEGEYCDQGACKANKSNLITGYTIKAKDFIVQQWYYSALVFGVLLLLIIMTKIARMNKKAKDMKVNDFLAEFSENKSRWESIRERLRQWDKMRQLKKKNKQNLKTLEIEKKDKVRITAPGIDSIVTFTNQKLYEGRTKREVKRALKIKGWNRGQIRQAFKKIKYDSRKPA